MNIKKVLKSTFISIIAVFTAANLTALEVNRNELESAPNGDEVVFRNYSGPHTVINTIEQIRAIGSALGDQVRANPENTGLIGSPNKYSVIHAIDPSTKEKMDADIFIIGKGATVDHITNLRRIISAYLEAAYGYSTKDAGTIATFITVYNAVYRGKIEYFQSKYKDIVIKNLSASIVGLSTNYEEWPGKTQIVIPLSDLNGGLSTIDTSLISDKEVVKSMQGEEDKGIDTRKDMVDIKEREADNLQEKADAKQSKADEEKAKLAEEQKKKAEADAEAAKKKAEADKAKAEADKKKAEADKAKKDAEANPDDKQAQKDADQAQKDAEEAQKDADQAQSEADEAQKDADDQAQKTDEQAQKTDEAQSEADEAQAQADKKRDEAQEERTSIAKDQQSLIREASYTKSGEHHMYGLKNVDEQGVMSAIIKMNSVNGSIIKESPVDCIRCRTAFDDGSWFIAVAGSDAANGVVRLVQIDKQNLEISAESAERLSDLSTLVEKDGSYYCTVQDESDYYIGKFNNTVQSQLISKVKVKGATPITITSQGIMVTSASGKPIILSLEDLTSISPE